MTEVNDPQKPQCPWCSEPLPATDAARCPSCNAALGDRPYQVAIPGLTEVDPALRAYQARQKKPKRTGLLGLLLGPGEEPAVPARLPEGVPLTRPEEARAIQPPSDDVRRAMLQIEIEAATGRQGIESTPEAAPTNGSGDAPAADAAPAQEAPEPPADQAAEPAESTVSSGSAPSSEPASAEAGSSPES